MKTSRENSSRPAFIFFLLLQLAAIFELPAQTVIVFSDDFNAGALDANKWLKGTNAGNQAVVSNGALQLNSQSGASAWLVTKYKYTARNTTVAVKFVQSGNDNNLGCSPTYNLSSPYGIFNETNWYRFYVYRSGSTGPFRLYVQWKKNNVEGGADVTGSLNIASTVYLRLRFDNTNIHFEASLDGLAWTDTYTEVFGLPGYTLDSLFHYELAAYSTPSKGAATFDDFVLTNTNVIPDTQPPTISNVAATNVTTSAATINWNTNEASDSQVEYGLTTSYGASTSLNTALLTSHSVALTGLQSNTLYHYRVKSGDAAGNLAIGGDFTFTTTSFAVQFVDITASAGVAGIPDHGGHAILFADVNGDELLDMYVTHTNFAPSPGSWVPGYDAQGLANFLVLPDELFINNGNNTFTESAAAAGVNDPGESHGAVFVDFDHDGDYDLFNGQRGPSGNRLYKNNGNGTFTEVTAAAGILPADRRTIGALALDIENDGDMDLFSANWGVGNEMYVNDGAGHFTVENRGVTDIDSDPNGTMSATAADVDNDGDMDIFMAKRIDVPGDACKLYINNGAGYFTDQAASRGVAFVGHANGAIFVDIDWDGDLDLLLAVSGIDRANPIIKLGVYRNQGNGTFVDETNVHNIPFDGYTLNAGDLDNDGDTDIFTYINSGTGQIWLNNGAGSFTAQTSAGFSHVGADVRAAALADTDNDGDLDVAFTEINAPTSFYRNVLVNGAPTQNYLQIELTGADGRAGMFGSKFYLYEAGHLDDPAYLRGYQQLTSVVGTLAQNSPIVHFGVAPAKTYDLRVKMLDGNSVVRTNITPGQRLNMQAPPDVTPPVISSVAATNVTTSSATINWNTNEASDTQVEYGLTTSYGASTPLNTTLLTNHSVSLSNLQANTLYHYRVKSKDAAGNLATSADFTLTTNTADVTPPVISTISATSVTTSSATINWSTNEASDSQVEYGLTTSYGASTALDATLITNHTVALSGLQQNTTYHYRVKSKDAAGNLATSADFTFTTLVLQVLDVTLQAETMPVKTNGDVRPPGWVLFEDGYVADNVNFPGTGTYDFTLRTFGKLVAGEWSKAEIRIDQVAKATITVNSATYADFAASFTVTAGTHQVAVAFINDLYAPPDDRNLYIDWLRVKSNTPADTQPPVISSVTATNVTTSAATINWSTNEASDSQVEYGLTTSYGASTPLNATLLTNHSVSLSNLQANTLYHYRVKSKDAAGNLATSADFTFTTNAIVDVTPPVISSVTATNVTTSSATINWSTNEASDSQVEYGLTTSYGASTSLNTTLVTSHSMALMGLQANMLYHYRVKSKDAAGNLATSADFTFTTLVPDVTPPVISSVTATGITPSSATINWSTNEASDTQVEYGLTTSYGASTALDATLITSHTVALSGLQQNTTYHYRVKSKDAAGNLATSADFTFTTLVLQALDVTLQAETMPVKTNGDVRPPGWVLFEDGYVAANVNFPVTGTYDFTLRAFGKLVAGEWSKAEIWIDQVTKATITVNSVSYADFAASFTVVAGTHQVAVAFINDLYAPPDDRNLYIDWLRVKSNTPADTQPPVISSVTATNVTTSLATITWSTDEASDTQVEYGLTTSYGASTPLNTTLLTNHAVSLTSLQANTLYHYRVKSKDAAGNLATSADFTLTTNVIVDVTPPVISSVAATNVTTSAATINWSTNEASDSQVEYGLTTSYGASTPLDAALITSHTVALSGLQQNTTYHYRVKSKDAAGNLATSADFIFQTTNALEQIVLNDPLTASTLGLRTGGQFSSAGWQATGTEDMIIYDLGRYIENGSLEIDLRNFNPFPPNAYERHHFLGMYRNSWGNHHAVEKLETLWVLHAGANYNGGVKLWSVAYDEHAYNTVVSTPWDQSQNQHLKVTWDNQQLQYFRNGVLEATHPFAYPLQLRYVFLGRDFTVSGDLVTNFKNNQYPALNTPIYANLVVKENFAASDQQPTQIGNINLANIYANGARLNWTTDETAVCYVEYGTTTAYNQRTPVFGPPAQAFSIVLANLGANQTYHYRIVATDNAGNTTIGTNKTFATAGSGTYIFKPEADTFVEAAGVYGVTRNYGNYGWTNLLAGAGRECYLRFSPTGLSGAVEQATLRLYGRQAASGRIAVHRIDATWDESNVTWNNKPAVSSPEVASVNSVQAGQWHDFAVQSIVTGIGTYGFAFVSADSVEASFDSRESTSFQPELIVTTNNNDVTPPIISNVAASQITMSTAQIIWTTNENSDSQIEYGLTTSYGASTSLNTTLLTNHAVSLSNLQPNTLYHYRVKSKDAAGNLATSGDFTFTTAAAPQNFDVTLQAESMPIKTNGDARPPGWALFENGYIAENVSFPAAGVYQFTLRARGMEANGEWSMAELWIDQVPRVTLNIDNGNYTDFMASFTVPAGAHEVAIAFVNDIYAPPLNRNLYVDWLRIQNSSTGHGAVKAAAAASTPSAPSEQFILQNFPNPFNAATRIRFALPRAAEVEVKIFDVAGRELSELTNGERAAGHHEVIWNGRRRNGEEFSSGVYLVRLRYRTERQGAWSQLLQRVLLVK